MKALFITTDTVDVDNHVRAWNSFAGEPAVHMTFKLHSVSNNWQFTQAAETLRPEIILYIGACKAPGNPRPHAFRALRRFAPVINLCSDAADRPWHPVLADYRARDCFDLQVALDGARQSPVDLAVLTPVDPLPFAWRGERDIRCGFSGSVGCRDSRSEAVQALDLTIRHREPQGGYEDHGRFMTRCQMVLNTSWTGTGRAHHIKGRVMEAGWAGCALLEDADSPIGDWFPKDCYLTWRGPKEAAALIAETTDAEIEHVAGRMAEEVRARFTPKMIYGEMLERVGTPL